MTRRPSQKTPRTATPSNNSESTDQISSDAESNVQDSPKSIPAGPIDKFIETLGSSGIATAVDHLRNIDPSHGSEQMAEADLVKYYISRFLPHRANSSQPDAHVSQTDQNRIAWLLKAIRSPKYSQAALVQLRKEFDQKNQLANCETVTRYLSKIDSPETLANLYLLRWQAIGHYQPRVVVSDLKRIQPRALEFGGIHGAWMNLVAESMNYTVWHVDKACAEHTEACWQEISENDQSWVADTVELLILAADQWKSMNGQWSAAIPWARNTLPETSRKIWMPVAEGISANPREALSNLDACYRSSSMAMSIFEEGLQNLSTLNSDEEAFDQPEWDETRELVAGFFKGNKNSNYAQNRISMMEFCIHNQLSPVSFAAAANSFLASNGFVSWFEVVQADGPLKCVVNACHATQI